MSKFCGKCGSRLDETGKCPNCDKNANDSQVNDNPAIDNYSEQTTNNTNIKDKKLTKKEIKATKKAEKKQAKKDRKKAKRAGMSIGQKIRRFFLKLLLFVLLLAVVAAGVTGTLVYYKVVDVPVVSDVLNFLNIKNTSNGQDSSLYTPEDNSVTQDSKTGIFYVNNVVLIFFEEHTTENEITRIVSSINGEIVGSLPIIDQYQVKINTHSLEEIKIICAKLKEEDCVVEATYDTAFLIDEDALQIPNDPWTKKWYTKEESWSESNPDGANWWLEAIQAQSAWNYNDKFKKIKIGVVDSGVDNGHQDLKNIIKYVSPINDKSEHGTHVSGIIGAEANNGKGISGLVWNCDLLTWDWELNTIQEIANNLYNLNWSTTNQILGGTVDLVQKGAKVINLSVGQTASMETLTRSIDDINIQGYNASLYLHALIARGYDFVIVQSAGNGNSQNQSVDAVYNGLYSSITKENCYVSENISADEIMGRIIIVGAAQNDGNNNYSQTYWSNAGDRVDICAPGNEIYSTVPGGFFGKYKYLSGTSMAAPIVTGVASLVWSVNSELTGVEVKNIVCDEKNTSYIVEDNTSENHQLTNTYKMVNANLAVRAAINYIPATSIAAKEIELKDLLQEQTDKPILQFFYDDYDSNGAYEAFAVVGQADESMGDDWYNSADVWFVSIDKVAKFKENVYGYANGILEDKKYSFLSLEKSAGGSDSVSYVFGVRNGEPQEMNVSESYGNFSVDENYIFKGNYSDLPDESHQLIYEEFIFDESTFEFITYTPENAERLKNTELRTTSDERDIVLVLDVSGSMAGTPLEETKKAATNFISTILKEDASIGIVAYDSSANMLSDFSVNEASLKSVVNSINDGGGTNIEAGLQMAEGMLSTSNAEKKIIVLMSDGEPNEGKIDDELVAYSDSIKDNDVYIYTLGFFENMEGDISSAQTLMEEIASDGCHYEVEDADNLVFFFGDIADQINGQKYIYVRIACPVDVKVTYDGETLCSVEEDLNTRTKFGSLTFEENETEIDDSSNSSDNRIKVLRLKEGVDYDIKIEGNGRGRMNYTIGFMDDSLEYTDLRKFKNIKINKRTKIDTVANNSSSTMLNVDEDGDGKYDLKYKAGINGQGEIVDYTYLIYITIGAVALVAILIIVILIKKRIKRKKRL